MQNIFLQLFSDTSTSEKYLPPPPQRNRQGKTALTPPCPERGPEVEKAYIRSRDAEGYPLLGRHMGGGTPSPLVREGSFSARLKPSLCREPLSRETRRIFASDPVIVEGGLAQMMKGGSPLFCEQECSSGRDRIKLFIKNKLYLLRK